MSKKQKQVQEQVQEESLAGQNQIADGTVKTEEKKVVKQDKKSKDKKVDKKDKKKDKKKENKNGGFVKKTKETVSELKKVTWPSFGEVVKKTGIVIAFVLLFGLFLYGVNALLGWLVSLLMG